MKEEFKKELAIVFGITPNLTFALANVLEGLKEHFKGNIDEVIVYHSGIIDNDKKLLNNILPCVFIDYKPFYEYKKLNEYGKINFSNMAFSIYECFSLVSNFKKVIWLDIDILIQDDFSEIIESDKHLSILQNNIPNSSNFSEPIEGYDMEIPIYGTGTVVFNNSIKNPEELTKWCYSKSLELAEKLIYPDQGIINLLLQEFNLDVEPLDMAIYAGHPSHKKYLKNAKIIHAYSPMKFWNYWNMSAWNKHYKKWIKQGGSPYIGKKYDSLEKLWLKYTNNAPNPIKQPRKFYKQLFSNLD